MRTEAKEKATRNRNPAFPAIDLAKAIELATILYEREFRKPMAPDTAAKHWGYSIKSSSALQAISALKQFGLLSDDDATGARKLKLTPLALKIIISARTGTPNADDHLQAIREAALSPKIYAELWSKAEDSMLPSDEELQHYLLLDRPQPYYEDAVRGLLKDFRSSIGLAELEMSDTSHLHGEPTKTSPVMDMMTNRMRTPEQSQESVNLQVLETDGTIRVVAVPRLSEQAFTFLKGLLDTYKAAIVRTKQGSGAKSDDLDVT